MKVICSVMIQAEIEISDVEGGAKVSVLNITRPAGSFMAVPSVGAEHPTTQEAGGCILAAIEATGRYMRKKLEEQAGGPIETITGGDGEDGEGGPFLQ